MADRRTCICLSSNVIFFMKSAVCFCPAAASARAARSSPDWASAVSLALAASCSLASALASAAVTAACSDCTSALSRLMAASRSAAAVLLVCSASSRAAATCKIHAQRLNG